MLVLALLTVCACTSPAAGTAAFESHRELRSHTKDALVFNGLGTASADADSVVNILTSNHLSFQRVNSAQLNAMDAHELGTFGMIIWPGGVARTQSESLSAMTRKKVYNAVHDDGVGYVGFCAGAFIAGSIESGGLGLAAFEIPQLGITDHAPAMVKTEFADGTTRDLVWHGGPELAGFGRAIALYPDKSAAISENEVGHGLVILSGPHPEAPQSWRDNQGLLDTDGLDLDIALKLIKAALNHQPLSLR